VVRTWRPLLTLDDLLRTRVLEITVHATDLASALGRPPWPTEAGMSVTKDILLALLGADLPDVLGWDDVTFAEKGTGRSALTDKEREALGSAADGFPLLA
jgi:hypothetical protein